jgi:type I restriction enzyme S subunit
MSPKPKPYPVYKDSGVEWLGRIPQQWEVSKLSTNASVKARLGWRGLKASEYVDSGYIFLSTPNIKGRFIDFENVNYVTAHRYFESPEIILEEGDVLIAKDGSTLGISNVVRNLPAPSTVNSSIAVIRPTQIASLFLWRFLSSAYVQNVIEWMKGGMGVPHLFQADLRKFIILKPPLEEQHTIANFLDIEIGKIDSLVARKERLLELLQEKRTAMISHTVTKGLNPNVPTKDSGFPWLGQIPAHWQAGRLKFRLKKIEQGWSPQCENRPAEPAEWGVLKVGCMNSSQYDESENKALPGDLEPAREFEIRIGDVLMSRANTEDLVGSVGIVHKTQGQILLCDKLFRLVFNTRLILPEYMTYLLRSLVARKQIEQAASGASPSMKNISNGAVANLILPFPPFDEQRTALQWISAETAKLDALLAKVRTAIDRLQEYRTALISAAVTGQIDVRPEA